MLYFFYNILIKLPSHKYLISSHDYKEKYKEMERNFSALKGSREKEQMKYDVVNAAQDYKKHKTSCCSQQRQRASSLQLWQRPNAGSRVSSLSLGACSWSSLTRQKAAQATSLYFKTAIAVCALPCCMGRPSRHTCTHLSTQTTS